MNTNAHVFKRDDPSTYPEFDYPMLVYVEDKHGNFSLSVRTWNKEEKAFNKFRGYTWFLPMPDDVCFYEYITHVPYVEKELHPVKCGANKPRCVHYDDGYCLANNGCKSAKVVTEYLLGLKRVPKEIE